MARRQIAVNPLLDLGIQPRRLRAVAEIAGAEIVHAKIGQLALENDFLSGALTKAGMLSAKR